MDFSLEECLGLRLGYSLRSILNLRLQLATHPSYSQVPQYNAGTNYVLCTTGFG